MSFHTFVAVRLTPHLARQTGWADQFGRVFGALGFRTRNPTAREFVVAVRTWQEQHPPLAADGLLGPKTWDMMLPVVRGYSGKVPAGTRPGWVTPTECEPATATVAAADADTAEDRALRDVRATWQAGGWGDAPSDLAVPVTITAAAEASRRSLATLPTDGLCGTLRVGQVWAGVAGGHRIIVALTTTDVVFVTDGGQVYRQPAAGWDADFTAGLYAGGVRHPAPLDTLHGIEVQALLGAVAATGETGFLVAVGVETGRWVVQHRADLARLTDTLGSVVQAVAGLRSAAPMVSKTVVSPAFRRVLAELPESDRSAWAAGALLVKLGKPALAWNAATVLAVLVPVVKHAATDEAGHLARELTRIGVEVRRADAVRVLREVRANPAEIHRLIDQLRQVLRALL